MGVFVETPFKFQSIRSNLYRYLAWTERRLPRHLCCVYEGVSQKLPRQIFGISAAAEHDCTLYSASVTLARFQISLPVHRVEAGVFGIIFTQACKVQRVHQHTSCWDVSRHRGEGCSGYGFLPFALCRSSLTARLLICTQANAGSSPVFGSTGSMAERSIAPALRAGTGSTCRRFESFCFLHISWNVVKRLRQQTLTLPSEGSIPSVPAR